MNEIKQQAEAARLWLSNLNMVVGIPQIHFDAINLWEQAHEQQTADTRTFAERWAIIDQWTRPVIETSDTNQLALLSQLARLARDLSERVEALEARLAPIRTTAAEPERHDEAERTCETCRWATGGEQSHVACFGCYGDSAYPHWQRREPQEPRTP